MNFDIDYKNLLDLFQSRSRLVRAFYYTALLDDQDYSPIRPLVDWLDYNGYHIVTKPTKEFMDAAGRRKIKGSMDIELATDMMEMADNLDHVVLFSGDGDFRRLVEAVQRKGLRVTVISTIKSQPPMIADELRRQADNFIELTDPRGIYCPPHEQPAKRQYRGQRKNKRGLNIKEHRGRCQLWRTAFFLERLTVLSAPLITQDHPHEHLGYPQHRSSHRDGGRHRLFGPGATMVSQIGRPCLGHVCHQYCCALALFTAIAPLDLRSIFDWRLVLVFGSVGLMMVGVSIMFGRRILRYDLSASAIVAVGGATCNGVMFGLPIMGQAFGDVGIVALSVMFLSQSVFLVPFILVLADLGRNDGNNAVAVVGKAVIDAIRNPLITAILAGVAVAALGIELPC